MSQIKRKWIVGLVLALLWSCLVYALDHIGIVHDLLRAFELKAYDYRMSRYRGGLTDDGISLDDVVIVAIDENSLAELGQFARWPRYYHAAVVDTLAQAGALAIGFDILFPEVEGFSESVVDFYAEKLSENDSLRLETLKRDLRAVGSDDLLGDAVARAGCVFFGVTTDGDRMLWPVARIAQNARGFGHVRVFPDVDGTVRRVRSALPKGDEGYALHLGVRMALEVLGFSADGAQLDAEGGLVGDGWRIPTDKNGDILLDFAGPGGTFLHVSFVDVLKGRVHPLLFQDRIVLIGATASGLMDHYPTPFSTHYPGVEVHATMIHDILAGRFIDRAGMLETWGVLFALSLVTTVGVLFLRPLSAAGCSVVLMGIYVVFCFERFATAATWTNLMLVVVCWITAIVGSAAYRYWSEERSKLAIKRAFSHYLSPDVVNDIAADPSQLGLGGDERVVSIGFVDIRGFTTLSEGLSAGQLAHFLNDYLSLMTQTILDENGMVDKYIGDAIMMLFGAPNPMTDQALRACRTALAMQRVVKENQVRWREFGMPEVGIGVGVNTGIAAVGNMGSTFRFDYTAMGDCVNLASRLEGLNKVYGTELIVGPETFDAAKNDFCFRELDFVRVKGKNRPVRIYELLGVQDTGRDHAVFVDTFETGLACFRQCEWDDARKGFESCLTDRPGDGPSRYYLNMIDVMIANPPPPDWEGVSVMEHK